MGVVRRKEISNDLLPGSKWRRTHQNSVNAILGGPESPLYRKVWSIGNRFVNKDHWPLRKFAFQLCEWAKINPGKVPDEYAIRAWVSSANHRSNRDEPCIEVMSTPDEVSRPLALALVGGDYHEAAHTKYSRRTPLQYEEVAGPVKELWGKMPYSPAEGLGGWAKLVPALLSWSNLIEDIYIERRLCREMPGTRESLPHLQDLILKMEAPVREKGDDLSVISSGFRDLGLGYDTVEQGLALRAYQKNTKAWAFLHGPLAPLLKRAIELAEPGMNPGALGSLWLSMEVLIEVAKVSRRPPPEKSEKLDAPGTPAPPDQDEQGEDQDEQDDQDQKKAPPQPRPPEAKVWKLGDRAKPKSGPYKGMTVEVVWAGVLREDGTQDVRVRQVKED